MRLVDAVDVVPLRVVVVGFDPRVEPGDVPGREVDLLDDVSETLRIRTKALVRHFLGRGVEHRLRPRRGGFDVPVGIVRVVVVDDRTGRRYRHHLRRLRVSLKRDGRDDGRVRTRRSDLLLTGARGEPLRLARLIRRRVLGGGDVTDTEGREQNERDEQERGTDSFSSLHRYGIDKHTTLLIWQGHQHF